MTGTELEDRAELAQAIWEHWTIHRRIEVKVADEMKTELLDHLLAAENEGKSIRSVLGPDYRQFADEWASVVEHKTQRKYLRMVPPAVVGGVCSQIAMGSLFQKSWTAEINVAAVAATVLCGFALSGLLFSSLSSRVRKKAILAGRTWIAVATLVYGLMVGIILLVSLFGGWTVAVPPLIVLPAIGATIAIMSIPLLPKRD